jgi:hypothetical protein
MRTHPRTAKMQPVLLLYFRPNEILRAPCYVRIQGSQGRRKTGLPGSTQDRAPEST